jgi:hypothetical protein
MAVPPLYVFGTVPNGQTIPLNWLDENFTYLENQITAIPSGVLTISGGATGLLPNVPTAGNVVLSGVLSIANGGTGASTLSGLQTNVFPSQSGNAGLFLQTDGTNVSWASAGGGGGVIAITNGGTGATTAQGATTNLLPGQSGNSGKVLSTNGSGVLSWIPAGGAATLTIGTSPISGGTSGRVLYDNAGILAQLNTTGTGSVVLDTTPLIVAAREKQTNGAIVAGVLTIDCNVGTILAINLTANITSVNFTNVPAATNSYSVILSFTADGTARTIAWPASVRWPNGTPPVPTSTVNKVDTYVLYTYDNGGNWFGFISGQNA